MSAKESTAEKNDVSDTGANILTKMTLKGMGCKPAQAASDGKRVPLARIYGYAAGVKAKEDSTGNVHQAIIGQFEGVNLNTGEVFRSGVLYLPGGIHELLAKPAAENNANVQFALEIHAIPAGNPIGYSYSAKSLLPVTARGPLDDLRTTLALGHEKK